MEKAKQALTDKTTIINSNLRIKNKVEIKCWKTITYDKRERQSSGFLKTLIFFLEEVVILTLDFNHLG